MIKKYYAFLSFLWLIASALCALEIVTLDLSTVAFFTCMALANTNIIYFALENRNEKDS
jgi:hypothetical protein